MANTEYEELLPLADVQFVCSPTAGLSDREVARCLFARCVVSGVIPAGGPASYAGFVAGTGIDVERARQSLCSVDPDVIPGFDLSLDELTGIFAARFPGADPAQSFAALVATSVLQRVRSGVGVPPTPQSLQSLRIEAALSYEVLQKAFNLKTRASISRMTRGLLTVPPSGWSKVCKLAANKQLLASVHEKYTGLRFFLVSNATQDNAGRSGGETSTKIVSPDVVKEANRRISQIVDGYRPLLGDVPLGVMGGLRPTAAGSSSLYYYLAMQLMQSIGGYVTEEIDRLARSAPSADAPSAVMKSWILDCLATLCMIKSASESKNVHSFRQLTESAEELGLHEDLCKTIYRKVYYILKKDADNSPPGSVAVANNHTIRTVLLHMLTKARGALQALSTKVDQASQSFPTSIRNEDVMQDVAESVCCRIFEHLQKLDAPWWHRFSSDHSIKSMAASLASKC